MSAAEKLRALDAPLPANLGEWGDEVRRRGAIFLDALSQIVAVVEELEKDHPYDAESYCPSCAVLIALDEALGGTP